MHALSTKKTGAAYPATGSISHRRAALQAGGRRSRITASTNARNYKSPARPGSNAPEILSDIAMKRAAAPPEILGDIAIAPETARRYAKKNGRSLQNEIRVLMLHGILHLMGYDHESDTGQMNRIERKLRRRLGIA
jgi:probable rRNA maturation factor